MASAASAPPTPGSLKRIVAASLIGTTIEWFNTTGTPKATALGRMTREVVSPVSRGAVGDADGGSGHRPPSARPGIPRAAGLRDVGAS
ncbi:hypothetical protein CW362_34180 [Streptomyces populi]|uniref:Uncharacterized protein n=1 Tax=Streptomyces populi TaxID=2058924 RepID=A0A2I0SF96_9ACTN|nr:hypothetical protein CW362_34180 [Streptomyces populi]